MQVGRIWPNQVELSWSAINGAAFYDVYVNGEPFARLDGKLTTGHAGSNEKPLFSNKEYEVIVAARDAANGNLDAVRLTVRTSSWSGSYVWDNPTDKDNKGKCRHLHYVLEDTPNAMLIKSELPELGLKTISPMPINTDWVDYNDDGALTYRANGKLFNTTNFTPSKFMVTEVIQDASGVTDVVKTKAVGMTFTTKTFYKLVVTEDGKRAVRFQTVGSGLAATGIFGNPEKGSDGAFTLVEE